jgi:5-methylcytosine-specific restriction endonuclease McrA
MKSKNYLDNLYTIIILMTVKIEYFNTWNHNKNRTIYFNIQITKMYFTTTQARQNPRIPNLNTCSLKDLTAISQIGVLTAQKVISRRTKHPFKSYDEVQKIDYIGLVRRTAIENNTYIEIAEPLAAKKISNAPALSGAEALEDIVSFLPDLFIKIAILEEKIAQISKTTEINKVLSKSDVNDITMLANVNAHIPNILNKIKKYEKESEVMDKHNPVKKSKNLPKRLRIEVWDKYFPKERYGTCMVCNKTPIAIEEFECAHIRARSLGGANSIDNIVPSCSLCNKSMGIHDLNQFAEKIKTVRNLPRIEKL